jgi:TPR repeat protein
LNLITGDGVPTDRKAGLEWVVKAAEAGAPLAARYVENKLQNGENIEIDETRMATALKRQADGGDVESMRVLAPMMIRGRGVAQDPQAGIALLLEAAGQGTGGDIEYQIGDLYLIGTNGLPANHEEGMKWYAISASRGNVRADPQENLRARYRAELLLAHARVPDGRFAGALRARPDAEPTQFGQSRQRHRARPDTGGFLVPSRGA